MDFIEWSEFISLCLTVPTIFLAGLVIVNYWPRAKIGVKHVIGQQKVTEVDLLVIGITVGFVGAFLDNLYWLFAWGSDFLNHPSREFWFRNGPVSNIPFRQIAGIAAAAFHLWPVVTSRKDGVCYTHYIAAATLVTSLVLIVMKFF